MIQTIIYQSEKTNFLGLSYDAIMSAFIAFVIVGLSYLASKGLENYKEKKRLERIEAYFWTIIENIIEPINIQIKLFRKTAADLENKEHKDFVYFETPDLNIKNFESIYPHDLHNIFLSKRKIKLTERTKHFSNILNVLEFVKLQKASLKQNFSEFFSDFRRYENSWQKNGEAIFRFFDNFIFHNKSKDIPASKDPFLKNMDQIINKWSKLENSKNFYVAFDNLIKPVRLLCKEYPIDPRANIILPYLVEAEYAFNNIVNVKSIYYNLFSSEADKLKQRLELLTKSINVLKNE